MKYYVQKKGYVGNCLLWWKKNNNGYTCDLGQARTFSTDDVAELVGLFKDGSFVVWPKEYIDQHAAPHVDHQLVDVAFSLKPTGFIHG